MSSEASQHRQIRNERAYTEDEHQECSPKKRRKLTFNTQHKVTNDNPRTTTSKVLTHNDYTVGWICALPLEMTATRAMLDEEHASLPTPPQDQNAYILGEICGHNVVVTCLPTGVYGNNSSAVVATHLGSTFRNISVPLLVGIGGGAPQQGHDIRLGDIVVGTPSSEHDAVLQYDFGKTVSNGAFEQKGSLNKPKASLLTALSSLRSTHQLKGNQIATHIANAFEKHNLDVTEFQQPTFESDILFEAECIHVSDESACHNCGPLQPIVRAPRPSTAPLIHYGTIASGNKVIKHAKTRDLLARQHGALCFEMEAAGLMDSLSCLVIRGICDYCDTNKDKRFQGYAALASAAYAKEFVSSLPKSTLSSQVRPNSHSEIEKLQHREQLMTALDFDEADSRRATVRKAHLQTCKWLLEQQEFRDWMDPDKFPDHHGLLWIKGKAGCGKSTLMKFILEEMSKSKISNRLIISFFFNARGHELEKSTTGMYRSLIHQLLRLLPELQTVLDELDASTEFDQSDQQFLRDTFEYALKNLRSTTLVCFVDALDECPEEQIRNMVEFFTSLGQVAIAERISFCVCFSSRHYPNISVDVGYQLILERQDGHSNDIMQYIKSELRIGKGKHHESLKEDIACKSNGIFLWVVLVVQILKREYDRGMVHKMRERIKTIPQELNDLFRDILTRDNNDLPGLMLCMQWTLYSQRQMNREEFYFALRFGDEAFNGDPWDGEEISIQAMENYILTCSKGLVELTRGKSPVTQFIHESVREFLTKPEALLNLWEGFDGLSEGRSHEQLKKCCYRQVLSCDPTSLVASPEIPKANDPEMVQIRQEARESFPFLGYALHHVMIHANLTEMRQVDFLREFNVNQYVRLYNLIQKFNTRRLDPDGGISDILARQNLTSLLRQSWQISPPEHESLINLLDKYIRSNNLDTCRTIISAYNLYDQPDKTTDDEHVTAILELIVDKITISGRCGSVFNLVELLVPWHHVKEMTLLVHALDLAGKYRRNTAMQIILDWAIGPSKRLSGMLYQPASSALLDLTRLPIEFWYLAQLHKRTKMREIKKTDIMSDTISCMSLLLAHGVAFDLPDGVQQSPLANATEWADASVLQFLLDQGTILSSGEMPLHIAVQRSNTHAVRFWLRKEVEVNVQNDHGRTPLHCAPTVEIAEILIDHGALISSSVIEHHSHSLPKGAQYRSLFDYILSRLTDSNDVSHIWRNLWDSIIVFSTEEVVDTLLKYGANPNLIRVDGKTPLHLTVSMSKLKAVDALLSHGANVNSADNQGLTPLHLAVSIFDEKLVETLLDRGADTTFSDSQGKTLLHSAVLKSEPKVIDALLRHDANANLVDHDEWTPLHFAVFHRDTEMVRSFLYYGVDVNAVDDQGRSPLHYLNGNDGAVKARLLIHAGAWIHLKDKQGRTPIQVVATRAKGHYSALELYNHGADPIIPLNRESGDSHEEWTEMIRVLSLLATSKRIMNCCELSSAYPI